MEERATRILREKKRRERSEAQDGKCQYEHDRETVASMVRGPVVIYTGEALYSTGDRVTRLHKVKRSVKNDIYTWPINNERSTLILCVRSAGTRRV